MSEAASINAEVISTPGARELSRPLGAVESSRLQAIDAARGLVIVLMVLDHTRDFFSHGPPPTDLTRTHAALFFTRWITHLCAPTFIFLAGVSAYLSGQRRTRAELQRYLLVRGAWLIVLEFTLVNFMWQFNFGYRMGLVMQVIWAIGASMCLLSLLLLVPRRWLLGLSLVAIAGHNLLDTISPEQFGAFAPLWRILHVQGPVGVGFVLYPLLPWVFVMALGYCAGQLFELPRATRLRLFVRYGLVALALFVALRALNVYGDPKPWALQASPVLTFLSFMNLAKYPPSLDYLLATLGIASLLLAWFERAPRAQTELWLVFGRVPLFAYVVHLGLVHLMAGFTAWAMGFGSVGLTDFFMAFPKGWGFGLAGVYCFWLLVLCLLYPLCSAFAQYKRTHRAAWLSYC
ncbi:MAG TPA: heparan-alpha-glucosaminide N-acetyltransferase domain-containing protein [Polyangiales bacterium]